MSPQQPSQDWPANAIPQKWVEVLFEKMTAFYGARFADLWRGADSNVVKRSWGIELAKLSGSQMKAGSDNLAQLGRAPTLPEFIAHCKQCRVEAAAHEAPQIAHSPSITPEQAAENISLLNRTLARMQQASASAEWAFRLILRGKSASGHSLPFAVAKCATDAITSSAGKAVVEDCTDPDLKTQYAEIRQTIVNNYRMRGQRLWETP
jgi:hypothetical protein